MEIKNMIEIRGIKLITSLNIIKIIGSMNSLYFSHCNA